MISKDVSAAQRMSKLTSPQVETLVLNVAVTQDSRVQWTLQNSRARNLRGIIDAPVVGTKTLGVSRLIAANDLIQSWCQYSCNVRK